MTRLIVPHLKNWTRIRIWKPIWESAAKLRVPEQERTPKPSSVLASLFKGHVGHASVQTAKFYASVYPDTVESIDPNFEIHTGKPINIGFVEFPQEDERGLKKPEWVFDFFSLDTEAMDAFFKQVKEGKPPYRTFKFLSDEPGFNCSDLTFNLLEQGGVNELLTPLSRAMLLPARMSFYTPTMVGNALEKAKEEEFIRFPISRTLKIPESGESEC